MTPLARPEITPLIDISTLAGLTAKAAWRLEGLRARTEHIFYWITRGQGQISVGARMRGIGPNTLIFIPAGRIFSLNMRKNTQGYAISIPDTDPVPVSDRPCIIKAASIFQQGQITGYCEQVFAEFNSQNTGKGQAIEAYATLLSVWIERAKSRNEWAREHGNSRALNLVDTFLGLLERDLKQNLAVEDYARSMRITAAHLSRVCQEHLGGPASSVIQARQVLESKLMLSDGALRIGEISTCLGFTSPGYFSRFFARHTNLSPREFKANKRPARP